MKLSAAGTKPRKMKLALLAAVFVVACAIGGGGYVYMSMEKKPEPDQVVRIDNLVSTLAGGAMVKLSVSVVLGQEGADGDGGGHGKQDDLIRDALIGHLRSVEKSELDGVAGLDFLRSALLSGARHALGDDTVKEVLIREFVVQ